jgi:hypothetical protein
MRGVGPGAGRLPRPVVSSFFKETYYPWVKANKKHSTILSYGQIWAQHLEKQPSDLRGFTQCHFFSGIGGWSRALSMFPFKVHILRGEVESAPVWVTVEPPRGPGDQRA